MQTPQAHIIHSTSNLGYLADNFHYRPLLKGAAYAKLMPTFKQNENYVTYTGNTYKTVELIAKTAQKFAPEANKLAQKLAKEANYPNKGLEPLLNKVFWFFYNHFQYRDDPGSDPRDLKKNQQWAKKYVGGQYREQIKTLSAGWHLRTVGVDCDDFSTMIGQVLTSLKIPFQIKKIGQSANGFNHVYIVVPKQPNANMQVRSNYWVVDPVLSAFDKETPNIMKQHLQPSLGYATTVLSGTMGETRSQEKERLAKDCIATMHKVFTEELNNIKEHRKSFYDFFWAKPEAYIDAIKDMLKYTAEPSKWAKNGANRTRFWVAFEYNQGQAYVAMRNDKIKQAGFKPNQMGVFNLIEDSEYYKDLKNSTFVGKASRIFGAIMHLNPLLAVIRAGVRLGIIYNLPFRHFIGAKLYPAIVQSPEKVGYSAAQIAKSKEQYSKALKLYEFTGGTKESFDKAIVAGYQNSVRRDRVAQVGKNGIIVGKSGKNYVSLAPRAETFAPVSANSGTNNNRPNTNFAMGNSEEGQAPSAKNEEIVNAAVAAAATGAGAAALGASPPGIAAITLATGLLTAITGLVVAIKTEPENISLQDQGSDTGVNTDTFIDTDTGVNTASASPLLYLGFASIVSFLLFGKSIFGAKKPTMGNVVQKPIEKPCIDVDAFL